jgi:hypothetical protein
MSRKLRRAGYTAEANVPPHIQACAQFVLSLNIMPDLLMAFRGERLPEAKRKLYEAIGKWLEYEGWSGDLVELAKGHLKQRPKP